MSEENKLRTDLKFVIFDCDGVLVDSEKSACLVTAKYVRTLGYAISDEDAFSKFLGKSSEQVISLVEEETGKKIPENAIEELKKLHFTTLRDNPPPPMKDARNTLGQLQKLGIPFAIASNSRLEEMKLKFSYTSLDRYIDSKNIFSAADIGKPKPNPDIYLKVAQVNGVNPQNCVVIEDSDIGITAVKNADMSGLLLRSKDLPMPSWWPAPHFMRIDDLIEAIPLIYDHLLPELKADSHG